jgi:predicted small secreted protein
MSCLRILSLTIAPGFQISLAGCNTIKGMEKDIQKAGKKI